MRALLVNEASQTCPSLKTGDLRRPCSPCTYFKHHLLVSKVVKLATCSPNCIMSSLSQCHPCGEHANTGNPLGKARKVLGNAQPTNLTMLWTSKHAMPCLHGSSTSQNPAAAAAKSRALLALARVRSRACIPSLCTGSPACAPLVVGPCGLKLLRLPWVMSEAGPTPAAWVTAPTCQGRSLPAALFFPSHAN